MADSRSIHSVRTCHVCGDTGFLEKIVTCFQCEITQEHVYCMPVLLLTVPKIWICEVCQSSEEKDSQQSFTGAHFPRILTPLNSEIVYSDTVKSIAVEFLENSGSLLNFQNETAIGTGKLNFICSEEVIEQPSGVLKVENFSPSIQGSIFGQSTAIMVSSRTDIGFKIPPSKFSKQIVKASPSIRIQERSLLPGQDGAESSLKTKRQVCKIKDKGTALAYQDKYALKKEPVDLLLPAKRVESPNSTLRKATKFTHSPSMNFQTITHSGRSLHVDVNFKSLGIQDNDILNTLPKLEKYSLHNPAPKVTWCGSFEISYAVSHSEFFDGFRAYVPGGVHCKAFEFSKQMPRVLPCTMLPSSSLEVYQHGYPNGNDSVLYFFPINFERSTQQYERLLVMLEMQDLLLISSVCGVKLLVFPSKRLNVDFHAGSERFLCGVYRPVKSELGVLPLPFCGATSQAQSFDDQQTKSKLLGNEVKMEQQQLNDSTFPPGYPSVAFAGR
ncbi:uncharacterized protein LOC8284437 isoform X1 [Ricinus communis]|uniref:uncharacterized protein LOC8284437 isoform X1 n=2 Tax=Ricinus communis TaxID=3988 RepID=UPI00201A7FE2|nr:uncharacterized protein LOC8284437 isoform X1 [Ricinus communis]